MRRSMLVVALLLMLGIATGLALQPDDGTAVSRPDGVGLKVDGANHAKPLPHTPSVLDLFPTLAVAVSALLLLLATSSAGVGRRRIADAAVLQTFLAPTLARRGPPA